MSRKKIEISREDLLSIASEFHKKTFPNKKVADRWLKENAGFGYVTFYNKKKEAGIKTFIDINVE